MTAPALTVAADNSGAFDLERFLPHQLSVITNRVSATLERMYSSRFGITVTGWRIMAALGAKAPLSSRELSAEVAMDAVTICRAVDQLVGMGYVSRRTDRKDRRRHQLRLTAKGRKVYDEVVPLAQGIERAILASLAPEDRERLTQIMQTLAARSAHILSEERDWQDFLD
ncbi:MAG: MarR family winged helix-turn-helix transcriptional regulator [Alphaproteobacteria bacterium]